MSQYRRLFLIVDPSMHRTPAFERAVWLARASGAAIHMCLFDYSPVIAAAGLLNREQGALAQEGYIRHRKVWLDSEAESLRAQGIKVTTDAVWAHPMCEEILVHVKELSPDLVIKDTHHEPLIKRVLLTPLDWQLLRLCSAPLLLVNNAAHSIPKRVIAAIDPCRMDAGTPDFNEQIIDTALALAIQCDAELHLVHAFNGALAFMGDTTFETPTINAELYEIMLAGQQVAFKALADAHGVPADRRHFLLGEAASIIAEFAQNSDTDVVVLGSVHRGSVDRMLMGSTAERILDYLPCNILAVAPKVSQDVVARRLTTPAHA